MPTSDEMLAAPAADQRNPRRRDAGPTPVQVGALVTPDERHEWERIILPEAVRASIDVALHRFALRDDLERVWNLSRIEPNAGKCVLNFYGRPGTGKTLTALGIARRLGRPLLQVDYSAVISKYLGDTAKHIVKCFRTAAEAGAVLFFDEADSLVSRRVPADESCSTSINQNRNTLMQELDRFGGVVILTTNLFQNYDAAMLRRISRHIEFTLPNRAGRKALFRAHLPNLERVTADLDTIALVSRGLSGGDIRNVCVNAMFAASLDRNPEHWRVTEEHLRAEIGEVLRAQRAHGSVEEVVAG